MTRRWEMHAGRDERNGGFAHVGHPFYVKAYGHAEVVPVLVTEDPDGPYWGWIGSTRQQDPPAMIQQYEVLFSMQFTYGPAAEVNAGKGEIVRLAITEIPA